MLILHPFTDTVQTGPTGVPAQSQPSEDTTSFVVFGLPSSQLLPGVAGKEGLNGWQSSLLQTPSPSLSPPALPQGSAGRSTHPNI